MYPQRIQLHVLPELFALATTTSLCFFLPFLPLDAIGRSDGVKNGYQLWAFRGARALRSGKGTAPEKLVHVDMVVQVQCSFGSPEQMTAYLRI